MTKNHPTEIGSKAGEVVYLPPNTVLDDETPDDDPIVYRIHRSDLDEQPLAWLVGQMVDAYAEHHRIEIVPATRVALERAVHGLKPRAV